MKKNTIIKTIWIWLDTETGDCFETPNLSTMCELVGVDKKSNFNSLINSNAFKNSKYLFWAQAEILNN